MKKISCQNLSFSMGKNTLFDNVSFEINEKDIIALVGENGVGKTTLLKLICSLIKSKNINNNLSISFMFSNKCFYPYLTGYQNLLYFASLENISVKKIDKYLKLLELYNNKDKLYKKYSLGMKQKLAICLTLIKDKDLYIFDEPLNGLDPKSIIIFNNIINDLKENNKTIIISSHILKELDYANKILFIKNKNIYSYNNVNDYNYYDIYLEIVTEKYSNYLYFDNCIRINNDNLNDILKDIVHDNIKILDIKHVNSIMKDLFI